MNPHGYHLSTARISKRLETYVQQKGIHWSKGVLQAENKNLKFFRLLLVYEEISSG